MRRPEILPGSRPSNEKKKKTRVVTTRHVSTFLARPRSGFQPLVDVTVGGGGAYSVVVLYLA